jgi:DNA (cytosine-5)-methyltransferase 1
MGEGGEIVAYDTCADSDYALKMRGDGSVTFNHFAGTLAPQNVERMKYVKPGGSWRDIPHDLLPKGMQRARESDHTKRYGRLRHDGLAGTILTKCDPHWGAVFLPDQDRALTVREAAEFNRFRTTTSFLAPGFRSTHKWAMRSRFSWLRPSRDRLRRRSKAQKTTGEKVYNFRSVEHPSV